MTDTAAPPTVLDVVNALDRRYPRDWAESWDRVGLVLGDFDASRAPGCCASSTASRRPSTRPSTLGADLIVAHHPLLLKPVSSIAPDTYKGRIIHRLIRGDVALYAAHTNADVANPGVSDALAAPARPARPAPAGAGDRSGRGRRAAAPAGSASCPSRWTWRPSPALRRAGCRPPRRASARPATRPGRSGPWRFAAAPATRSWPTRGAPASTRTFARTCVTTRRASISPTVAPLCSMSPIGRPSDPGSTTSAAWLGDQFGVQVTVSDVDTDPWTVHAFSSPSSKETLP